GQRVSHERLRAVDEDARWASARVLDDLATRRVRRGRCNPGEAERDIVGDERVATRVLENHWIVWRGLVDEVVRLEALHDATRRAIPFFLVPTVSLDPGARLGGPGCVADHGRDVLPRRHAHEVELRERHA